MGTHLIFSFKFTPQNQVVGLSFSQSVNGPAGDGLSGEDEEKKKEILFKVQPSKFKDNSHPLRLQDI